jgi:hypothetical protein
MRFVLFSKRNQPRSLNTTFLLLAQYNGKVVIPLEEVRRDFFAPDAAEASSQAQLRRHQTAGQANGQSHKCAKGVHLQDLAGYFETRRQAAKKELSQMSGWN